MDRDGFWKRDDTTFGVFLTGVGLSPPLGFTPYEVCGALTTVPNFLVKGPVLDTISGTRAESSSKERLTFEIRLAAF